MTKVKICGITNLADARAAIEAGADMLGFNFYTGSPRYIDPKDAFGIIGGLDANVLKVGVFVNMSVDEICRCVRMLNLDVIQLHGDEDDVFVRRLKRDTGVEVIKAFRIGDRFELASLAESSADSVLLDAFSRDAFGGTGERCDWDLAADAKHHVSKLFLAGGLKPENVGEAIARVRPFAVDAASGVESASGQKDHKKMREFVRKAKQA